MPASTTDEDLEGWLKELEVMMSDLAAEGYADPCPATGVFVFNDPSHQVAHQVVGTPADRLWIKHFVPLKPRVAHPEIDIPTKFMKAFTQRVSSPAHFPDPNWDSI
jgi:hypothetical protein